MLEVLLSIPNEPEQRFEFDSAEIEVASDGAWTMPRTLGHYPPPSHTVIVRETAEGRLAVQNIGHAAESLVGLPSGEALVPNDVRDVPAPATLLLGNTVASIDIKPSRGTGTSFYVPPHESLVAATTLSQHRAETDLLEADLETVQAEQETRRIDSLLDHIATQSHFEDRYELRSLLAKGGMGKVYQAYDRILRRDVAIKMMSVGPHDQSTAVRGQFLKEARVGGRLLHPNILAVFDLGVNRDHQIYYTMRLVEGASLQHSLEAVQKGVQTRLVSFPLRKLVRSLISACEGVDYAHQNGVIHLDIKPQNILLSGFNEVFVIDWGLARVDEVDDTEQLLDLYRQQRNQDLTSSSTGVFGHVLGTPAYMAPEQMVGSFDALGPTTDVFGLGGILYFVLYGKPPNPGSSNAEILTAFHRTRTAGVLREGILPRGKRIASEVVDAVRALEQICLKALSVQQQDRYADAEKLTIELNEWLQSTSTSTIQRALGHSQE